MSLDVDQLAVTSFITEEGTGVALPYTQEKGCYSPLCMPTALPEQCPDKTVATTPG